MNDMAENTKKIQCTRCRHYLAASSCGACANKKIESLKSNTTFGLSDLDGIKMKCKVIMNDMEEFDKIDPFNCKYFLSKEVRFAF